MNTLNAIMLKIASALLFAVMSALVRFLGQKYPVGQTVFFRSAFAILPHHPLSSPRKRGPIFQSPSGSSYASVSLDRGSCGYGSPLARGRQSHELINRDSV